MCSESSTSHHRWWTTRNIVAVPNRKVGGSRGRGCSGRADKVDSSEQALICTLIPTSLPPSLNSPTDENSTPGIGCHMDMGRNTKQCCVKSLQSGVRQVWVWILALRPTWEPQFLIYETGITILPYEGIQEAHQISSINCLAWPPIHCNH